MRFPLVLILVTSAYAQEIYRGIVFEVVAGLLALISGMDFRRVEG